MKTAVPLACFLSIIRPPGVQYENALLQIAPVDKSKCPFIKDKNDIGFQLYTRHNPTVYHELMINDDEKLFASNIDFNDRTVLYFHAFMEQPDDGSGIMVREALMQRGDTNVIMVDASRLEAGPWYFTAAHNTWYIGQFAARFIDYMVTRGLNLNATHFIGHSLGAQAAGVAGGHLKTGRVARITGLDPALPLFDHVTLEERLDPSDAHFVDVIHTDAGIFGYPAPIGHADFYPNGGKSPQPGCELEIVIPQHLLLNKYDHDHAFDTLHPGDTIETPRHYKTQYLSNADLTFQTTQAYISSRSIYVHPINNDTQIISQAIPTSINRFEGISSASINALVDYVLTTHLNNHIDSTKYLYESTQDSKLRKKRFAPLYRAPDSNNALSRLLQYLLHNKIPILSFIREMHTIVHTANGEFKHFSKESYIGQTPLTGFRYGLDLGGQGLLGVIKKYLGLGDSDRLIISNN